MPVSWPAPPKAGTALEIGKQLSGLSGFFSILNSKKNNIKIDSLIMIMHCKITVYILMIGTIFLGMKSWFGDPIECISHKQEMSISLIQHYCWIDGTFTIHGASSEIPGVEGGYPAVRMWNPARGERRYYHKYYHWVYFLLIFQGILYYTPRFIWKKYEDKRLCNLISGMSQGNFLKLSQQDQESYIQDVADSLFTSSQYYHWFIFCELCCPIHMFIQFWFTNIVLGGSFLTLGWEWILYAHSYKDYTEDPLIRVFPRMAKCSFHRFGYSGSIESIDALCFLTLNTINEKLFIILWFWYLFVILFSILILFSRLLVFLSPHLRFYLLMPMAASANKRHIRLLVSKPGNWFILKQLATFMKPSQFRNLIDVVMEEHFDANGKPDYSKSTWKSSSKSSSSKSSKSKDKKHSSKHSNKVDFAKEVTEPEPSAPSYNEVENTTWQPEDTGNEWNDDPWPTSDQDDQNWGDPPEPGWANTEDDANWD